MISALGNMWFVIFMLLYIGIQLFCIAIDAYFKERRYKRNVKAAKNRKSKPDRRKGMVT